MEKKKSVIIVCCAAALCLAAVLFAVWKLGDFGTVGSGGASSEYTETQSAETERTEKADASDSAVSDALQETSQTANMQFDGADPIGELLSGGLYVPENTSELSFGLALRLLALSYGNDASSAASVFERAGFEVVLQKNYDKSENDISHTCAFTVGSGTVNVGTKEKDALLVSVRGTNGAEWYSNFDFAPSREENGIFAENFLRAANDIFDSIKPFAEAENEPLVIVCGYSRGAAAANILGLMLDASFGKERVAAYTYATPATVRGDFGLDPDNIFNFINPCDLVPRLPLEKWGFKRAGCDVILKENEKKATDVRNTVSVLESLAPSVGAYYYDKHSLTSSGISEDGMSAFEAMNSFAGILAGMSGNESGISQGEADMSLFAAVSPESDLAPVFSLLSKIASGDTADITAELSEHMPDVYASLIAEAAGSSK